MSWSVFLIRTQNNNEEYGNIQDEDIIRFSKSEIINAVIRISEKTNTVVKDIDTDFVHLEGKNWSIEFCFWDSEPYDTIELQIRGIQEPAEELNLLQKYLNARLFDMHSEKFISKDTDSGFDEWKKFCDEIINDLQKRNDKL